MSRSHRLIISFSLIGAAICPLHAKDPQPVDTIGGVNFTNVAHQGKNEVVKDFRNYVVSATDSIKGLNGQVYTLEADNKSLKSQNDMLARLTDETIDVFNDSIQVDGSMPYILRERQKVINSIILAKSQLTALQNQLEELTDKIADMVKYASNFDEHSFIEEATAERKNALSDLLYEISDTQKYYLSPQQQKYFDEIYDSYANLIDKFY